MRIDAMEIHNFKALKGERQYDFPEGIIGITGKNGKGKSTLANAIAWSLYGSDALRTGRSDVVTWGEKSAAVALAFETHDGLSWSVERTQSSKGVAYASLYNLTSGSLAATGVDAVNKEVQRVLALDRVGFLTSVYARQEELAGLMSLTPANRVKTVLRLLRLEQLSSAIEQVRGVARDRKNVLHGLRMNSVNAKQVQSEIKAINEDIDSCKSLISEENERLAEIEKERNALIAQQVQLVPLAKKYEIWQQTRSKAEIAVAGAESEVRYAEREAIRPEPPKPGAEPALITADDVNEIHTRRSVSQSELIALKRQIDALVKNAICTECKRPFYNMQDRSQHISELDIKASALRESIARLDERYAEASRQLSDRIEWESRTFEYNNYQENQERAAENVKVARERLAQEQAWLDGLEPVEDVSAAHRRVSDSLMDCQISAGQIRETLATLAERVRGLEVTRENLKSQLSDVKDREKQIKQLERNVVSNETAAAELMRLKESMISRVIPALSERASRLVSEFTDGRYSEVSLTSDYEIQYRNDFGDYKGFDNLSGGEQDVFALALRLAISDLRAGDIGLLMLDEVMESLDADRQEATWNAIERLTGRYNQILLVTHVPAFKDRAEHLIAL